MSDLFLEYYRCPERFSCFDVGEARSKDNGYFRFGPDAICYGSYHDRQVLSSPTGSLHDALLDTTIADGKAYLPFDWMQVVDNLRYEEYAGDSWHEDSILRTAVAKTYYFVRPILPVMVRKHLQRIRLNGWHHLKFPLWPVDRTVDNIFEQLLVLSLRSQAVDRIPFIWFWPEGASSCAIVTHDVETASGRDFCTSLMDLNDSFGIKASFQVVPERRYGVTASFLESIRARGFEINVQDLNHDGYLFRDHQEFILRAAKINAYAQQYGAVGFRAGVLYRRQRWLDKLNFAYDTSVPNVAHLDPQRGGCCTVMPYFNGKILELPVTTTQDYSLFHILNDYSIDLWKRQIDLIMEKHGLMNFIIHPDYIIGARERRTYETLLAYLSRLRVERKVWIPLPREVDQWWRQRSQMKLVRDGNEWHIEGPGCERAQVAYASEKNGQIEYTVDPSRQASSHVKSEKELSPPL
jgi:hypothetical protein